MSYDNFPLDDISVFEPDLWDEEFPVANEDLFEVCDEPLVFHVRDKVDETEGPRGFDDHERIKRFYESG